MAKTKRAGAEPAKAKGKGNTGAGGTDNRNANALSVRRLPQLDLSLPEKIEQVLIAGDLSPLSPEQRLEYYKKVCLSLNLNPLTSPFTYILFREGDNSPAKLQLYANKDCAAQLRKNHVISVYDLKREISDGYCIVEVKLGMPNGKMDTATGMVPLFKFKEGKGKVDLSGREYANAIMKSETKAKRRGTLSICGLAFMDESETDGVDVVGGVTPDGRIWHRQGYDPAEDYRRGSREAAQNVLEEKLSGKRPLAEKAPQEPTETQEAPSGIPPAVKPEPMGAPASAKWVVTLDWADETAPILTADAEALEVLKDLQPLGLVWGKDSFWHLPPRNAEKLREFSRQFPFTLDERVPKPSSEQRGPKEEKTTRTADKEPTNAAAPRVVKGTLQHFTEKMTKGDGKRASSPFLNVLIKTSEGDAWYSCFDRTLFDFVSAGKGKQGEFILAQNGTYWNLVGFKRIGAKEFDEDGKTPVIQRKEQQPGRTLFGQ